MTSSTEKAQLVGEFSEQDLRQVQQMIGTNPSIVPLPLKAFPSGCLRGRGTFNGDNVGVRAADASGLPVHPTGPVLDQQ